MLIQLVVRKREKVQPTTHLVFDAVWPAPTTGLTSISPIRSIKKLAVGILSLIVPQCKVIVVSNM